MRFHFYKLLKDALSFKHECSSLLVTHQSVWCDQDRMFNSLQSWNFNEYLFMLHCLHTPVGICNKHTIVRCIVLCRLFWFIYSPITLKFWLLRFCVLVLFLRDSQERLVSLLWRRVQSRSLVLIINHICSLNWLELKSIWLPFLDVYFWQTRICWPEETKKEIFFLWWWTHPVV